MKKTIILSLATIILCSLLTGCSMVADLTYKVGPPYAGYTRLHEWKGEGDFKTEIFSISSSNWSIRSYNLPKPKEGENSSNARGLLEIIVYNAAGEKKFTWPTDRPVESNIQQYEPGEYYLSISATNTKWQVCVDERADEWFTIITAGAYAPDTNVAAEGLPLGCKWNITGELSAMKGSKTELLPGKTIQLEEMKDNAYSQAAETKTELRQVLKPGQTEPVSIAAYSFNMEPVTKPGIHLYRIVFQGDSTYPTSNEFIQFNTIRKINLTLKAPEKASAGSLFEVSVTAKDYLDDKPVSGAPINLQFSPVGGDHVWTGLNYTLVTDTSGTVKADLGKGHEMVFPGLGDWLIKPTVPQGTYGSIDYKASEGGSQNVDYGKGAANVSLKLSAPPTVSFSPFSIACRITNDQGEPIGGNVSVILFAKKSGGVLPLPMGTYEKYGSDSIVFDLSLESGNYEFWADFAGNEFYDKGSSEHLPVSFP